MKYDILTAMDINVDLLLDVGQAAPEFGQKEKLIRGYELELGGSSSIFACQAAKLGLKTAGIGVVGEDTFGKLFISRLSDAGVSLDYVRTDSKMKTGMGVAICRDGGDRAILTYPGTIDSVKPEDLTEERIRSARHIHVGSYFLMKKLMHRWEPVLKYARRHGVTVSLDTNWDPEEKWDSGLQDILKYVNVFFPNENEIRLITGKSVIREALDSLLHAIPVIALKLGKKGAAVYTQDLEYWEPPVDVRVVDTVGAGDSFDAGFLYGYLNSCSLADCLKIGCICGSYNTSAAGGIRGQPKLDELLKILKISSEKER